jgi:N-acetylneuraminate synthase
VHYIDIARRQVGPNRPCFVIAEAGVNHNGDAKLARQLVDVAVQAAADAVKFQSFKAEGLVTRDAPKAEYQLRKTASTESQYEMLRGFELSDKAHYDLKRYCDEKGILLMSSPFDQERADFLDLLGVAVFKIPSGEITNLPFLTHVARKGKPMIVSTGMASLGEVESAINAIQATGNQNIVLLQCVSNYPANSADVNLRAMHTMATAFDVPVGYSDHTIGIEVALAAVALGACVIEKHFTLDRTLPGPDHRSSLEPEELAALVHGIRKVESALGHGRKESVENEANIAAVARKSLVAARDIPVGASLTEDLIAIKRPGTGLPPVMREYLVGRKVRVAIPAGALITLDMLA